MVLTVTSLKDEYTAPPPTFMTTGMGRLIVGFSLSSFFLRWGKIGRPVYYIEPNIRQFNRYVTESCYGVLTRNQRVLNTQYCMYTVLQSHKNTTTYSNHKKYHVLENIRNIVSFPFIVL